MPRKWTNHGNPARDGKHIFPGPTPVRTVDLRLVDAILAMNARISGPENSGGKKRRRRRRR